MNSTDRVSVHVKNGIIRGHGIAVPLSQVSGVQIRLRSESVKSWIWATLCLGILSIVLTPLLPFSLIFFLGAVFVVLPQFHNEHRVVVSTPGGEQQVAAFGSFDLMIWNNTSKASVSAHKLLDEITRSLSQQPPARSYTA